MKTTVTRWIVRFACPIVLAGATAAQAGVWGDVVRGLSLVDYRVNGQRNFLGDGWDINAGAVYQGQTYDFGFADLTLGATSPAASNIQLGYTLRGIPSADFSWTVGTPTAPLSYQFNINNGIQDFSTISGNILIDVSTDINVLGFYDTRIQISNRGTFDTDGFFANEVGDLNFDVGPIDVSGNIYADFLAAVTQPFFAAAGTENPFTKFTTAAAKQAKAGELEQSVADLRARVEAGDILTDTELAKLVNAMLLSSILTGDPGNADLLAELTASMDKEPGAEMASMRSISTPIPEPATLLLLLPMALLLRRRC